MKKVLPLTAALILCFSVAIPSASSYGGGGGIPPNVMLGREKIRLYAPPQTKKDVKKRVMRKRRTLKRSTGRAGGSSAPRWRSQGSALSTGSVTIKHFTFQPQRVKVKVGTTVTWTNKDSIAHTVTGDTGVPDGPRLGTDESYSYTFTKAGIFPYHCTPHPYMTGVVEVAP